MGVKFSGDWAKALELSSRAKMAVSRVLQNEADELANQMRKGLASGSPAGTTLAPLHPLTAALKGSQVPLAGMERWVAVKHVGPYRFFVGFTDPEGIRIGLIHEQGRSWSQVWTDRQRRWFFATMSRFGLLDPSYTSNRRPGEATQHTIPARPWLQPVVDAYVPGAQKRIHDAIIKAILR